MNARKQPILAQADTPAIVRPHHVQDRPATDEDMKPITGKTAWRAQSSLELTYDQGRLQGGSPDYTAEARYLAGLEYADIWAAAQSSGSDSTQALNISRSTGGGGLPAAQAKAISQIVSIHSHMGEKDRIIVRMVCGEGHWPSEAVKLVCGDYKHTVAARFREALDSLVTALERARKTGFKVFSMAISP